MELPSGREFPEFAKLPGKKERPDPTRCVRLLNAGDRAALAEVQHVFSHALLYMATEILPRSISKYEIARLAVRIRQALWNDRLVLSDPGDVKIFLYKTMLELCRKSYPETDERASHLVAAFTEIARGIIETESALPQRLQRFYRLRFVLRKPDPDIASELNLSEAQIHQSNLEISALIAKMPRWE